MAPRIRTSSAIEKLIVDLRDKEHLTYEEIGARFGLGKGAIFKIYKRFKAGPIPELRGRPRKTSERYNSANFLCFFVY